METAQDIHCENLLLSLLPPDELSALLAQTEHVDTPFGMRLFERDKPIEWVWFPCSGEHSIIKLMADGSQVETGTVGREGLSPVDVLLGATNALEGADCQIAGTALRMPVPAFQKAVASMPGLNHVCQRYLQAYLSLVSQSVACNRLHPLEQRFARWVLMSADRVGRPSFQLTQDYMAIMLGVHRPSVSLAAQALQQRGLIRYSRGQMEVLDRAGLEKASCECYHSVRERYRNLLGIDVG